MTPISLPREGRGAVLPLPFFAIFAISVSRPTNDRTQAIIIVSQQS